MSIQVPNKAPKDPERAQDTSPLPGQVPWVWRGSCGWCYILFNSSQQQSCIAYKMQYLYSTWEYLSFLWIPRREINITYLSSKMLNKVDSQGLCSFLSTQNILYFTKIPRFAVFKTLFIRNSLNFITTKSILKQFYTRPDARVHCWEESEEYFKEYKIIEVLMTIWRWRILEWCL